jgi:hypothetical protein
LLNIVQSTAVWSAWAAVAIFGSDPNSAHDSVRMVTEAVLLPARSVMFVVR